MPKTMQEMMETMPQVGKVEWISIRPERRQKVEVVQEVNVSLANGLEGDHYIGKSKNRQVTLIQGEHLDAVANILQIDEIDPALIRRNIIVRGINLLALAKKQFQIGTAILETTGPCEPCSRMEENLGDGGYNAMRGHGGICTRVIKTGLIKQGDAIKLI